MDNSKNSNKKPKIFKYTDENGNIHYVDENGNPVKRKKPASPGNNSNNHPSTRKQSSSVTNGKQNNSKKSSHSSKKHKHKKKNKKGFKIFLSVLIILGIAVIGFAISLWVSIVKNAPNLNVSEIVPSNYTSIIYDDAGNEIDKLHGEENREYVTLDMVPENLKNAVVAIEDERFYDHNGIDIKGIFRALVINIKERSFSQGASTITQQLIKNRKLPTEKTIIRKIQEQYLAVKYEKELQEMLGSKKAAKDYILELYLNTIALNHGLNGVGSAAEYYFGKEVSELDLAECASIAGITKHPSKYSPISNPQANKERQTLVLDKMLELEYITKEEYDQAINEDIYSNLVGKQNNGDSYDSLHNYFVDHLVVTIAEDLQTKKGLSKQEAFNLIYSGGLQIYSTMSQDIQTRLENVFADDSLFPPSDVTLDASYTVSVLNTQTNEQEHHFETRTVKSQEEAEAFAEEVKAKFVDDTHTLVLDNLSVSKSLQAAMAIMDQKTGYIKAIVGGRGEKQGDLVFNRATQAYRQPGSCFKVLASYAPAIDQDLIGAGSFYKDEPYTIGSWTPRNWWGSSYRGYATVRDGIKDSMNILAAKVITDAGVYNSYNYLKNFGFENVTEEDINANTSLGGLTNGVTVLELTAAYATIANGGVYMKPTPYSKILDHDGNVLLEYDFEGKRVIKETTAYLLTDMMKDVVSGGGTGGLARFHKNNMPVAGKTGTTSDDKDLTFAGYTPYYVAGIWMGYDSPKPIKYDKSYHLIVWRTIMDQLHDNLPYKDFDRPDGITSVSICAAQNEQAVSGLCNADYYGAGFYGKIVSNDLCASTAVPSGTCSAHSIYKICKDSGCLAGPDCPDSSIQEVSLAVINGQIINRPSEESCKSSGKIFIDINRTCDASVHKGSQPPVIGENNDLGNELNNVLGNINDDLDIDIEDIIIGDD